MISPNPKNDAKGRVFAFVFIIVEMNGEDTFFMNGDAWNEEEVGVY